MNQFSSPTITTTLRPGQVTIADASRGHYLTIFRCPAWWNIALKLNGATTEFESMTNPLAMLERLKFCASQINGSNWRMAAKLNDLINDFEKMFATETNLS